MPRQAAICTMGDTPGTEGVRLSTIPDQTASGNNEGTERQEEDKMDAGQKSVRFDKPVGKLFERIETMKLVEERSSRPEPSDDRLIPAGQRAGVCFLLISAAVPHC